MEDSSADRGGIMPMKANLEILIALGSDIVDIPTIFIYGVKLQNSASWSS